MRRLPPLLLAVPLAAALAPGASAATPAEQTVARAADALARVSSYRISQTVRAPGGVTRITARVTADGRADITLREGGGRLRVISIGRRAYLRGDVRYWQQQLNDTRAARDAASAWIRPDASLAAEFTAIRRELAPASAARCLAVGTGTLELGDATTVGGRRARTVFARGDAPGTTPGRLLVEASGRGLPLAIVQTGPRVAGGELSKRCQDPQDDSTASSVRFSRFGASFAIRAPRAPEDLPTIR